MEIKAYFDGVSRIHNIIDEHLDHTHWLQSEVWARIAIPVQSALILIETAVNQTLRGVSEIIAGCLMFKCKKIFNGVTDLFVMVIQVVALAIIAVASFIIPGIGFEISHHFMADDKKISEESENIKNFPTCVRFTVVKIADFIIGIFSIPSSIVRSAVSFGVRLFSFDLLQALMSIFLIIKEPIVNLGLALIAIFNEKAEEKVDYSLRYRYLWSQEPYDEFTTYKFSLIHS